MNKPSIKAVFFDMGGVVVNMVIKQVNQKVIDLFELENFSLLGSDPFLFKLFELLETNKIDEKEFWSRFAEKHNKPLPDSWRRIFGDPLKHSRMRPKIKKLIFLLKDKGLTVSALSNISEPFARRHYALKHYGVFHYLFLSHELGIRKPDKDIFFHALKKVGVSAYESIFIDDNKINIETAEQIGMHAIFFKNSTQLFKDITRYITL